MASKVPITRKRAWVSEIPHLLVMGLLIYICHLAGTRNAFFYGALCYMVLSIGLRSVFLNHHKQGIKLTKEQKFAEAVPFFEKSVDFFARHNWMDKYRYLTLLSSSAIPYKEMGYYNINVCYIQIGDMQKAEEYQAKLLAEFPETVLVKQKNF